MREALHLSMQEVAPHEEAPAPTQRPPDHEEASPPRRRWCPAVAPTAASAQVPHEVAVLTSARSGVALAEMLNPALAAMLTPALTEVAVPV